MANPQRPTPQEMGDSILRGVKDFVSRATQPLQAALKALGERIDALPDAGAVAAVKTECDVMRSELAALAKSLSDLPVPTNGVDGAPGADGAPGKDCDIEAMLERLEPLLNNEVALAVKTLPKPADGKDGAPGEKGADCDMAAVEAMLDALVAKRVADAVATIPPAPAGKDGANGEPGLTAFQIAKDAGFDGSVADWLISLRGKDGTHGLDGRDAAPGEPGRDGISCDEIVAYEEGKHFGVRFMKGDKVLSETKWLKPSLADLDEGTWQSKSYERGAHVTWGGSTWFAKCDTAEEPGRGEDWRLMAKKGRDGRDKTDRKQVGDRDVYMIPQK